MVYNSRSWWENKDNRWEDFSGGSEVKNLPANEGDSGDVVSIPGSGRSPGGENGNPL